MDIDAYDDAMPMPMPTPILMLMPLCVFLLSLVCACVCGKMATCIGTFPVDMSHELYMYVCVCDMKGECTSCVRMPRSVPVLMPVDAGGWACCVP